MNTSRLEAITARWLEEAALFRRRGHDDLAGQAESYAAEIEGHTMNLSALEDLAGGACAVLRSVRYCAHGHHGDVSSRITGSDRLLGRNHRPGRRTIADTLRALPQPHLTKCQCMWGIGRRATGSGCAVRCTGGRSRGGGR